MLACRGIKHSLRHKDSVDCVLTYDGVCSSRGGPVRLSGRSPRGCQDVPHTFVRTFPTRLSGRSPCGCQDVPHRRSPHGGQDVPLRLSGRSPYGCHTNYLNTNYRIQDLRVQEIAHLLQPIFALIYRERELKDSGIRSIWTCLTASLCYTTNTKAE